ncbi:MAG: DUF3127 domain-containing protein [Saprospiraceae bacterium]
MSYDFTGKLHRIFDEQQIKDTFRKREFVIEKTDGQYPNFIKFELIQDRCSLLDAYNEGDEVTVSFDLRGREWQDKYFTNLHAWRIQGATGGAAAPAPAAAAAPAAFPSEEPPAFAADKSKDDLPF